MKLTEFKNHLSSIGELDFVLPNGEFVPKHFHITEAGLVTRHFIDCGGKISAEKAMNLQVWVASDTQHRLSPSKLLKIMNIAESHFGGENLDVEVEYQGDTIGRYGLNISDEKFILTAKHTECRAQDSCGIPEPKQKLSLSELQKTGASCCTPGGGCC